MDNKLLKVLKGARNVVKMVGVERGEQLLLVADSSTEGENIDALRIAGEEAGVTVSVIVVPEMAHTGDLAGKVYQPVPRPLIEAVRGADAVIQVHPVMAVGASETGDSLGEAIRKNNARSILQFGGPDILGDEIYTNPLEIIWAISEKIRELLLNGKTLRVKTPAGSDFSAAVGKEMLYGVMAVGLRGNSLGPVLRGQNVSNPLGVCGLRGPVVNGVAVCEQLTGIRGMLSKPIRWEYRQGEIVAMEGGYEAESLRKVWGDRKPRSGMVLFGVNPKASPSRDMMDSSHRELERSTRTIFIHADLPGVPRAAGYMRDGSLWVDDHLLIKDGHLTVLDDPEVIEVARRFGDPEKLLAEAV